MSLYPSDSSSLKFTAQSCLEKKRRGEKISCLTAYDYALSRLLDESGIDLLLVGDSQGMVVSGYDSTLPVTVEEMLPSVRAVRRGARRALVVADMPYGSYHTGRRDAVRNALRFIKAGAEAVKIEGGERRADLVHSLVEAEIPVMAHIGLTPQSVNLLGGYRVQGKTRSGAEQLLQDARALQGAGAFSVVLEGIPREVAGQITREVSIPTIGIGAGPECDGQILVIHDLVGLSHQPKAKFVRQYADLGAAIRSAAEAYRHDVEIGEFPSDQESYHLPRVTHAIKDATE